MPITRAQQPITEIDAALANHIPGNSHPQYQNLLPITIIQQQVGPPGQISIVANNWFSLGILNNLNSGNSASLFLMALYIQYIVSGTTETYWQYSGSCQFSPIWWKAAGPQLVKYLDMESHNSTDFTTSFRLGLSGQGSRMVELFFPQSFAARVIRATFVRLLY